MENECSVPFAAGRGVIYQARNRTVVTCNKRPISAVRDCLLCGDECRAVDFRSMFTSGRSNKHDLSEFTPNDALTYDAKISQ